MEKRDKTDGVPCYPLAALLAYIKRRGLVSQGNRKCGIYTHLQK